jgi:hypothetical protein
MAAAWAKTRAAACASLNNNKGGAMKLVSAMLLFVAAVSLSACSFLQGVGWTTLIDGTSGLENFNRIGDANWRPADGAIVADRGKGGQLVSKQTYKDFQIRAEFWADHTTNSGIFIRAQDPSKVGTATAYEVNIFDQREGPEYSTGAIVDVARVAPIYKAGGKWNTLEITASGPVMTVVFNGVQTVNVRHEKFAQGYFSLQFGNGAKGAPGGAIKWRKVQIREL